MRIAELSSLFDYHYWTIGRVLQAATGVSAEQFVAPGPVPFGDLRATLVHILDAEERGRRLLLGGGRREAMRPETFPDVVALRSAWLDDERAMRTYLATLDDGALEQDFSLGSRGALPLWQLLMHLVIHGAQHRSEAAVLLTEYGRSPGDLDLFYYAITGGLGDEGVATPT